MPKHSREPKVAKIEEPKYRCPKCAGFFEKIFASPVEYLWRCSNCKVVAGINTDKPTTEKDFRQLTRSQVYAVNKVAHV
jgi:ribosomal protein L37AE/L43A